MILARGRYKINREVCPFFYTRVFGVGVQARMGSPGCRPSVKEQTPSHVSLPFPLLCSLRSSAQPLSCPAAPGTVPLCLVSGHRPQTHSLHRGPEELPKQSD